MSKEPHLKLPSRRTFRTHFSKEPAYSAAMPWWDGRPEERYWVEITDRAVLGSDLVAPQFDEEGRSYWSYDLVNEVAEGDVVLHYAPRPDKAIASWSRAIGDPYEDTLIWGAHGQAGGRGPVDPYERPAWRRPLEGPFPLARPISLEDFRGAETAIREVHDRLKAEFPSQALYFPFQLSSRRPVRAFQGYMTKWPRELLHVIPDLAALDELAEHTRPSPTDPAPGVSSAVLGTDYRRPDEEVVTSRDRDPHSVDPNLVDRALRGHRRTQNLLQDALVAAGFVPRSPAPGEPEFDIAWDDGDAICIAEVKSMSNTNEEKQLRLAVGQVLRYAYLLSAGRPVRRFIAVEREPRDPSWLDFTAEHGIGLIWPETFLAAVGGHK